MHDEEEIGEQRKESREKWLSTFSSMMINRAIFILTFQRVRAVPMHTSFFSIVMATMMRKNKDILKNCG